MRREEPFFIHTQKHVLYTHMCVYVCAGYAHVTFHSFIHNRNDTVAIQGSSHASTQFMRGVARRFDFRFTDMCVRVCVCVCVSMPPPLFHCSCASISMCHCREFSRAICTTFVLSCIRVRMASPLFRRRCSCTSRASQCTMDTSQQRQRLRLFLFIDG